MLISIAGGLIGYERERTGKAAGLRTHMLVALSSAVFVLAPSEAEYVSGDISRVIQGVATGIGFLGSGTIIKQASEADVRGLTTAAGIWLTAAIGVAAGMGRIGLAVICAVLAWTILDLVSRFEGPSREDA